MNQYDEMMEKTQATAQWVLICLERERNTSDGGIFLGAPQRQPFARVVSVGELCKTNVKKGDRIIYKEGINVKELEGMTSCKYMFVWEPNICGKAAPSEAPSAV